MNEHKSWEEKTPEERAAAAAKIKAYNDRSRKRVKSIFDIAAGVLAKTIHAEYEPGQYGQDYMAFGKAIGEIRKVVKESVFDVDPDYEMLARQFARPCFDADKLATAIEALASEKPIDYPTFYTPGWLVDLAKKIEAGEKVKVEGEGEGEKRNVPLAHFPSGADGTEPAEEKKNPFYEFYGLKLQRFGGPGLDAKLIGKRVNHPSSQPSVQVFEIDLKRGNLATGARAFVTENGELLFSIVGGKSFAAVNEMAVSALHALLKRRDKANKRHKARRAAKRAAAAQALINKELA